MSCLEGESHPQENTQSEWTGCCGSARPSASTRRRSLSPRGGMVGAWGAALPVCFGIEAAAPSDLFGPDAPAAGDFDGAAADGSADGGGRVGFRSASRLASRAASLARAPCKRACRSWLACFSSPSGLMVSTLLQFLLSALRLSKSLRSFASRSSTDGPLSHARTRHFHRTEQFAHSHIPSLWHPGIFKPAPGLGSKQFSNTARDMP